MVMTLAGCAAERPASIAGQPIDDVPRVDAPWFSTFDVSVVDGNLLPRQAAGYPGYDVSYVLPFNGPEQSFTMEVEPRAGKLDVHVSVDTTGSFGGEIQSLKTDLQTFLIPQLRARVSDLAMGVSRFADFPVQPFGVPGDRPYDLLIPITTNFDRVSNAVFSLDQPLQNGGDVPEGWIEALYQIGTGTGLIGSMGSSIDRFTPRTDLEGAGTLGGVGFREGSARVVVNVTDAASHDPTDYGMNVPGTHSLDQTASALRALNIRLLGIASGEPARAQLQALAIATGAVTPPEDGRCITGVGGTTRAPIGGMCPLVFDISPDGTGLARTTLDAIARFLDSLAFATVTGAAQNDTRSFVRAVEPTAAVPPPGSPMPRIEDRLPVGMLDGIADTFAEVPTRTHLTFRIRLRNVTVAHTELPQVFFLRVSLTGDGIVLGERIVRVLVPEGPKPDSGVDVFRDRTTTDATDALSVRDVIEIMDVHDVTTVTDVRDVVDVSDVREISDIQDITDVNDTSDADDGDADDSDAIDDASKRDTDAGVELDAE
jgi:hypothetical protein